MLIVGAGVVGTACALALLRAGLSVTLVDRAAPGTACSYGNAGHIATEQVFPLPGPDLLRRLPSLLLQSDSPLSLRPAAWPHLAKGFAWHLLRACRPAAQKEGTRALSGMMAAVMTDWPALLAGTAAEGLWHAHGHDAVWEGEGGETAANAAHRQALAAGLPVRRLGEAELARMPAALRARGLAGLRYLATAHVADPAALVQGLFNAFIAEGGRFTQADVTGLHRQETGWRIEGAALSSPRLLVTAGVWTGRLLTPLGVNLPLIAERGYHVHLPKADVTLERPLLLASRNCIATPMGEGMRVTGFTEFATPELPPDTRKPALLRNHLRTAGLMQAGSESRDWMGCRPTLPDYLPALGALPGQPGLYVAAGHQHLGLTLAATTAAIMVSLLRDGKAPDPAFRPDRFSRQR